MTDEPNDESESGGDAITELQEYDKWPKDVAIAFDRALGVASRKYIKNKEVDFASVVADCGAIEAEFLVRMGDNEENAQQVRRLVTEMLLRTAWQKDEPLETCQRYWNDLLQLGFSRIEVQYDLTWSFADFCRAQGQTEIGLGVLEPFIAELERLRTERTDTEFAVEYYKDAIGNLRRLRAQLEAQKKMEPSQMADEANDESESDGSAIADETDDQDDGWQDPLSREFAHAKHLVTLRCRDTDFVTAAKEYRDLLDEFLPKIGHREDLAIEVRRRIAEEILVLTYQENEPFEICQHAWNDLLQLGFSTIECQCQMTHFFVKCCDRYGQTELGLAVLDPLIVELKRLRAEPTVTMLAAIYYDDEFRSLRKLRARLEAQKNGETSDDE